jgi:hypothetical protein
MAGHTKAAADHGSAKKNLFELQVEQHHHDEKYHREIARLSVHQRLNHMALHFAKYTGKIAASSDPASLTPVYVDVFIIAISTANILNIELCDLLEQDGREYPGLLTLGRSLAVNMIDDAADHSLLVRKTAIASGRIAAACEKIDHLEEILFRAEIRDGLAQISGLSLAYISLQGIDAGQAVRQRLSEVKQRLKLHGRI